MSQRVVILLVCILAFASSVLAQSIEDKKADVPQLIIHSFRIRVPAHRFRLI